MIKRELVPFAGVLNSTTSSHQFNVSCRAPIDPNQLQRFTIEEDRPPPPKPVLNKGELVPVSRREIQYNMIGEFKATHNKRLSIAVKDSALFADIQTMESNGSYGNKIQTLVRHLLYIQLVDPGAKSIVFSAWADSLASEFVVFAS